MCISRKFQDLHFCISSNRYLWRRDYCLFIPQVSPELSTRDQRREFQTQILNTLMDHLLAADVLLGEQAALPVAAGGSYTHMANNVFYLAGRVVDKLWQGENTYGQGQYNPTYSSQKLYILN